MSVSFRSGSFPAKGSLKLVRRHWATSASQRVLVLVHGLGEHSERYDSVARWLAERGFSVHALDLRGHGDSEGPRKHTPSFDTYLDDLECFLALVREEEPGAPVVLLGHSMGGLIVGALLAWRQPEVEAAVLSGPAFLPRLGVGRVAFTLGRLLSRVLPRLRVPSGIDPAGLSRDPAVQQAYVADPRINEPISLRLGAEVVRAASAVRASARSINVPVLIVHGEADPLCRVEGSRAFHAQLEPEGCEIRTYPGLRHEVLNEPEREQVLEDIHGWLEKRFATGPRL